MISNRLEAARPIVASLVSALLMMLCGPSFAVAAAYDWMDDGTDRWINTGGYFVIGGITGWENFDGNQNQDFNASLGFQIRGGARLNKYIALEVAGDFLSGFDTTIDLSSNTPPPPAGTPTDFGLTLDGGNVTANILAYYPFGRIQPYALLGLGGMWAKVRSTDTTGTTCYPGWYSYWYCSGTYTEFDSGGAFLMKFGGGVDFYLTEDWALTLDVTYVMPFGDLEVLDYVNLGWGVRFNF